MANIQSSVNQMISLAGLLASQSPSIRARSEKRAAIKNLSAREKAVSEVMQVAAESADSELAQEYATDLAEIKKQQFEVDPSTESFLGYRGAQYATKEGEKERSTILPDDPEEIAEEQVKKEGKEEKRRQEVEYYKELYRGTAPQSKASDPYAELFKKYGADAYEVADTHSQDAQRRLAETRRRNKEVVYGSEND